MQVRHVIAGCVLAALGTLGGCGSVHVRDADIPPGVASQIRTCATKHEHLERGQYIVRFDVKLTTAGDVDTVALRDSTLGDEPLEGCIARALREISLDDLPVRRAMQRPSQGPGAPEFLGQEEVLAGCLTSPPCLITLGFFAVAAYIVVEVFVDAAQASKPKAKAKPKPWALPIDVTDEDKAKCLKQCVDAYDRCNDQCDADAEDCEAANRRRYPDGHPERQAGWIKCNKAHGNCRSACSAAKKECEEQCK